MIEAAELAGAQISQELDVYKNIAYETGSGAGMQRGGAGIQRRPVTEPGRYGAGGAIEELAATINEISGQAQILKTLIGKFKLKME